MAITPAPSSDRFLVDLSLLIVRVTAGVIFAAHGSQKLFGAFGGPGIEKLVEMMGQMGMPAVVTWLISIGEFFGGIGLILGFLARFSATANTAIMIGAIALVHGQHGFFLQNQGFEYNLALIGLLLPTVLCGPGRFSIGRLLPLPRSRATDRPVLVLE
jgi:putative oxidoreductase